MWIETEDGRMLNLFHVAVIDVENATRKDGTRTARVVGYFDNTNVGPIITIARTSGIGCYEDACTIASEIARYAQRMDRNVIPLRVHDLMKDIEERK